MTIVSSEIWVDVCGLLDIPIERGVAALINGRQIALLRDHDGVVHAVDNRDPFSGAYVMARGIVGTHHDRQTITSPMYKQAFDLNTGECIDDPTVCIPVYAVRLMRGRVMVGVMQ